MKNKTEISSQNNKKNMLLAQILTLLQKGVLGLGWGFFVFYIVYAVRLYIVNRAGFSLDDYVFGFMHIFLQLLIFPYAFYRLGKVWLNPKHFFIVRLSAVVIFYAIIFIIFFLQGLLPSFLIPEFI